MERGVYRLNLDTREKQRLVEVQDPESTVQTHINDGKCDAKGRLWIGSMSSTGVQNLIPEKNNFWSFSKGQLKHKLGKISLSNGITWTCDNRTMFYVDTVPGNVYVFDFDLAAGEITKILTKISFPAKYTSSCCFGGKNYDTLYVTSGSFRPDATRPEDGRLFKVTELGVKGKAAYEFGG
ncbi:hypothetical protein V5799_000014 [Amblyomma americanum]|uniref:SMP-30/Gluconolactonase/LRE-like region domain-containing protein n=1 Tax=Amblyomma americanum TaxID=6943 RepID=A0AAQ4D492_AMBAM